ncbi:MAG TPA: exosortase/archaeosortase family protein [Candidatus Acidoferrales bacterium]|nr:exosortase/archaeosortase family protein [Candidatus Acidoferrales bacterium]
MNPALTTGSLSSQTSQAQPSTDLALEAAIPPVSRELDTPASGVVRSRPSYDRTALLQYGLLTLCIVGLYFRILVQLVDSWIENPNYSHGFFVPVFCAWVIWRERRRFAEAPIRPSNAGLLVICGALGILILGVFGAELFLSRTSLLFLLAGLLIYFRGWRFFRVALFPWAVLFLMIPLPAIIFNQIALPLQFEASKLATGMLGVLGVPVLREGNIIHLPALNLDVVEACSGIRSLVSLITLAAFYGYLCEPRVWRRWLLVISAVPIAVFANGVRIMGSGLLGQYWSPDKAEGFFHMFSGVLIFAVSLLTLIALHQVLSWPMYTVRGRPT